MTIPPELAALQRYGFQQDSDSLSAWIGKLDDGLYLLRSDVIAACNKTCEQCDAGVVTATDGTKWPCPWCRQSAWPQRGSGEAVGREWMAIAGDPGLLFETQERAQEYLRIQPDGAPLIRVREVLSTHPAATSAQVAIYFCSGPSGSIWALDESEIEPTIKQFAEAHGDDPGEYTATPFYSKPADTSALRECLRECANRLSDFIIRYDNAQPADPHEIGLLHRHFAEARVALERARTLLAGEGI